jgi:ATP-binding cassette subfamily F protein uup
LLSCEGLSKGYGGRALFQDLGFHLSPGERVGIVGPNGAGKTTLLRVLLGDEAPDAGEVTRAPSLKVAYFDQARAGLDDALSVYDTIAEGSDRVAVGDRHLTVHAYLDLFLFDSHRSRQRVGSLSGGERARVALARMLRGEANLLVLDEPTNDLDLFALTALEELLSGFPGAALVVTHDRWFLDRVATSLLYFEPDGRVVQYAGGWDDCLLQRASAARSTALASPAPSRPPPAREPKRAPAVKALTPPEARELESLPAQVDAAEAELSRREARLNDPGLYARGPAEAARRAAEAEAQREVVRALTARWEALEARRG